MPDKKLTDSEQSYYFGIRRCGDTWEYCNGNCEACVRKDYYVSNKLEGGKMSNKPTDNEIIKALECCSNRYDCYSCEYYNQYCKGDMNVTLKDALDLINRLQAENERLKSDVSVSKDAYMSMKDRYEYEKEKVKKAKQKCIGVAKALKTAKSEAYKEFAERLKENSIATFSWNGVVLVEEIDNLLKEMVGDKE